MALGSLSGASSRAARWPAVAGPGASPSRGPLTRTPRPRPCLPAAGPPPAPASRPGARRDPRPRRPLHTAAVRPLLSPPATVHLGADEPGLLGHSPPLSPRDPPWLPGPPAKRTPGQAFPGSSAPGTGCSPRGCAPPHPAPTPAPAGLAHSWLPPLVGLLASALPLATPQPPLLPVPGPWSQGPTRRPPPCGQCPSIRPLLWPPPPQVHCLALRAQRGF